MKPTAIGTLERSISDAKMLYGLPEMSVILLGAFDAQRSVADRRVLVELALAALPPANPAFRLYRPEVASAVRRETEYRRAVA